LGALEQRGVDQGLVRGGVVVTAEEDLTDIRQVAQAAGRDALKPPRELQAQVRSSASRSSSLAIAARKERARFSWW
jgi:hypothetical protein